MRSILLLILGFSISYAFAQSREYKTVYVEKKVNGEWSGTKKTGFWVNVSVLSKGGPYELTMWDKGIGVSYRLALSYETETSDGQSFHSVVGGVWGESNWTSPSSDTKYDWILLNKNIANVLESDPKPFDIEIQFSDGSAVKYYISP